MENKSHAIAAGTFVLLVTALLIAMAVWLTRDTSEQRIFEISSRESVNGLQPQAGVRFKGVLVGRVTSLGLDA
jgi:phospholipid/cholesterol/gamma-HCH transport system substrate-binding protein